MNNINYRNIADSIDYYQDLGYTNVELPWYVTQDVMNITKPKHISDDLDYYIPRNDKVLVASGEQSFLYLIIKGILQPGKYQGVTPCYRFEPINQLHRKTFIKNELILFNEESVTNDQLLEVVGDARKFFETKLMNVELKEVPQDNSIVNFDLMYKGEELGSYGIRKFRNISWIYGTGCAEPRLSIIQSLK
jgi:hypothetical protein